MEQPRGSSGIGTQPINSNSVQKHFVRNTKNMKGAKGVIYATNGSSSPANQTSGRNSGGSSPAQLGSLMLTGATQNGILQGQIGRSVSNERNNQWTKSSTMKVQSLQESMPISGNNQNRNHSHTMRSNGHTQGYRSPGRGGGSIAASSQGNQHNQAHNQSIFLNSELKGVLQNNTRKTRAGGNNQSLTMPIGNQMQSPNANDQNMVKSIGNSYNLRGSKNGSAQNFNTVQVTNHHKLVRYKNSNDQRDGGSPQHLQHHNYRTYYHQPIDESGEKNLAQMGSRQVNGKVGSQGNGIKELLLKHAYGEGTNGSAESGASPGTGKDASAHFDKERSVSNGQKNNPSSTKEHQNQKAARTKHERAAVSASPMQIRSAHQMAVGEQARKESQDNDTNNGNYNRPPSITEVTNQRVAQQKQSESPLAKRPFQLVNKIMSPANKFKVGTSTLTAAEFAGQQQLQRRPPPTASPQIWNPSGTSASEAAKYSTSTSNQKNAQSSSPPQRRQDQAQAQSQLENEELEAACSAPLQKPHTSPRSNSNNVGLSKTLPHGVFHQHGQTANTVAGRSLPKGATPTVQSLKPQQQAQQQIIRSNFQRQQQQQESGSTEQTSSVEGSQVNQDSITPTTGLDNMLLDRPNSSAAQPLKLSHVQLPNFESTKFSVKENGVVKAYAANTNQGIVRDYNEDRVSIVLNMQKPPQKKCDRWPKCSFFAIFDGHGGHTCADFLRDNLHQFIIRDAEFPQNPRQAIINGFWKSEMYFLDTVEKFSAGRANMLDRSGSCAIVTLFVDDVCYSANVGDSRAIMSCQGGRYTLALSHDHKPNEKDEHQRIISAGGKIYQTQTVTKVQDENAAPGVMRDQILFGPHRVFPGRLSVSRTFGDIEAKRTKYLGNPKVVIATPDIKCFKIEDNYDFIVLGCDGIFDKLVNTDVIQAAWEAAKKRFTSRSQTVHENCGFAVESILKLSVAQKSMDNITVVIIAFKNFRKTLKTEIDCFTDQLRKQRQEMGSEANDIQINSGSIEDSHAAEQIENKRFPPYERGKESGIVISKILNLPNYDLTLQDVELQPTLVGLARLQKLTTGSRNISNNRGSPTNHTQQHNNQRQGLFPFQQSQQSQGSSSYQSSSSAYPSNMNEAGSSYEGSEDGSGSSQFSMQKSIDQNGNGNAMSEKHQFIMNRRRGTAGPLNPKQADLMIQSKLNTSGAHPNFIKTRHRSPLLPNAIQGISQVSQQQQQQIQPHRVHIANKQSFDPIEKPGNVGSGGHMGKHKPPIHSNAPSLVNSTGGKNGAATSNGIRSNSIGGVAGSVNQNYPGMAESLRSQIATPRNNQSNVEEQQQLAQHRRYTNIVSQSRARRQIGNSYGLQVNTSLNTNAAEDSPITGLFSPSSSNTNQNIFSSVTSPQNSNTQSLSTGGQGLTLPPQGAGHPARKNATINFSKPFTGK